MGKLMTHIRMDGNEPYTDMLLIPCVDIFRQSHWRALGEIHPVGENIFVAFIIKMAKLEKRRAISPTKISTVQRNETSLCFG